MGEIVGQSKGRWHFSSDKADDFWDKIVKLKEIPDYGISLPHYSEKGSIVTSWSFNPQKLRNETGTKYFGIYLGMDGEIAGALTLWETDEPFAPEVIQLLIIFCDRANRIIMSKKNSSRLWAYSSVLKDLLAGNAVEKGIIEKIYSLYPPPYRITVTANTHRKDAFYGNSLVKHMRNQKLPCIPLNFDSYIVILAPSDNITDIVGWLPKFGKTSYYITGVSLPFYTLESLDEKYRLAKYALDKGKGKAGVYYCEDYGFDLLFSSLSSLDLIRDLLHPTLGKLKAYDKKNNTDFYETLYQYLLNERSRIKTSEALNIHRNSLMYRINRIESLCGFNLEDPNVRMYILISYKLAEQLTDGRIEN
jgi:hypothetical protein